MLGFHLSHQGCRPWGEKCSFFSPPCFLSFQGLGKAELFSVTSLVQSFANGNFLILIGVWLNCSEPCTYLFWSKHLSHPAEEVWPQEEPDLKTRLSFESSACAPFPSGLCDDGWNFFIDCRIFFNKQWNSPKPEAIQSYPKRFSESETVEKMKANYFLHFSLIPVSYRTTWP